MKSSTVYITACLALALGLAAVAADNTPAPPTPPAGVGAPAPPTPGGPPRVAPAGAPGAPGMMPGAMERRVRSLPVGPSDAQGPPRRVRGQILVTAVLPTDAKVVSVELFCNNALLGQKSQAPYQVDFNSETISDGTHTLKAIGLGADGKQVWTANTKIEVQNSKPGTKSVGTPNGPVQGPSLSGDRPRKPTEAVGAARPHAPGVGTHALGSSYSSAKHGFTVRYPAGWTAKDRTNEMTPPRAGNAWVELAAAKDAVSSPTINIRRTRLSPGTSADVFAKFNPYVASWERKTVLGSPAFATTSNTSPKQVTHRLIVIRDGYAWMLNCVGSADTAESSRALFESVVGSLALGRAPGAGVTIKEIRK